MNKENIFHSGCNKYSTLLQKAQKLNVCLLPCDANHMMLEHP